MGDVVQLGHSLECDPSAVRVSDSTTMHQRFDRKTLRTEQEKKITLGHKEDDQEEEQIWQQTADVLEEMIKETRSRLATLMKELEQDKEKAADLKNSAAAVQKEYDKIMSWADLYAGSSIEGKKMILRQLIDRVNIGRDFEIEVEFKISVAQFFDFLKGTRVCTIVHPEHMKKLGRSQNEISRVWWTRRGSNPRPYGCEQAPETFFEHFRPFLAVSAPLHFIFGPL